MKENVLNDKSLDFAVRVVRLQKHLVNNQRETVISKQIMRSGTSIGANINEANYAQSKADFISKLHVSLKETAETEYWLKLLVKSELLTEQEGSSLINDCLEIKKLLIASINTAKNNHL